MGTRRQPGSSRRGFTLVEAMVAITVVAILGALSITSFSRGKQRANLKSAAAELQSLLHQARESALASGTQVAVLVYPGYTPASGGRGYFIVYQDACFDFFTGGARCGVRYETYAPATPAAGSSGTLASVVVDTMALPTSIMIGPSTGMGAGATLPAPLSGVTVTAACSFCGTTGGAVVFDASGQASFWALDGATPATLLGPATTPAVNGGGSLSLTYDPATGMTGRITLVIFSASGATQAFGTE